MAVHIDLGKRGEKLAAAYLIKLGYTLLHSNWRHAHYEIDLIALKNEKLHFIEVKIRSNTRFGLPEANVTPKKIRSLLNGVEEFLYQHPHYRDFQLDILSINMRRKESPEFFLIEDVYA